MQINRKLLFLVFVIGMLGGVVGYALSSYVVNVYIEITQPAATVKTYEAKIDAAPYQYIERYVQLAEVHQNSDKVKYTVTVKTENFVNWKIRLWIGYLTTTLYEGYTTYKNPTLTFTIDKTKTMNGIFYIYATIQGKTKDTQGKITLQITAEPQP